MKNSPSKTGDISETKILAALVEAGFVVSKPFNNSTSYDFIIDNGQKLLRVQCKTAFFKNGAINFYTASQPKRDRKYQTYKNRADIFIVYDPHTKEIYLVPVDETPNRMCSLRSIPAKGKRKLDIKEAKDYKFDVIVGALVSTGQGKPIAAE